MNYTSEQLFPDWYKVIDSGVSTETLTSRKEAINNFVEDESIEFWLDIVRIALGIIPTDNKNKETFIQGFRDNDETFPLLDNDNLIKALASIAICFKIEEEGEAENNRISLAIINTIFLGQYEYNKKISFVERSFIYFQNSACLSRELHSENEVKKLNKIRKNVEVANAVINQTDTIQLVKSVKTMIYDNIILSEELNVLWWVFGEYSRIAEQYFKQIDQLKMVIIGAKDLSDLTKLPQGFYAAKEILNRVLLTCKGAKSRPQNISLFDIINLLDEDIRKKLIQDKISSISELTPCLLAIHKSTEVTVGDDWSGAYKKQTGGDIKKMFSPIDITFQLYREFLFIK